MCVCVCELSGGGSTSIINILVVTRVLTYWCGIGGGGGSRLGATIHTVCIPLCAVLVLEY